MADAERKGTDRVPASYMDGQILAADNTLIRCTGDGPDVTVPARAGELNLSVIGSGAVIACEPRSVRVEEGYRLLKRHAIVCHGKKKTWTLRLELPATVRWLRQGFIQGEPDEIVFHTRISPETLFWLKETAVPCEDGAYLLAPGMVPGGFPVPLSAAAQAISPPLPVLRREMCFLMDWSLGPDVFKPVKCRNLMGGGGRIDEYAAVMRMIRQGQYGWRHPEAERSSDERIRTGGRIQADLKRLSVAEFRPDRAERMPDGNVALDFICGSEKLFFPALQRVRWDGVDYYLYSRNYFTEDAACPYLREDICVFSEKDGLVTDRKISEAVYAKTRLLALL